MYMRRLTLILALLVAAPLLRAAEVLPFIENDYGKAVARAKKEHLPLFVDAWAPW